MSTINYTENVRLTDDMERRLASQAASESTGFELSRLVTGISRSITTTANLVAEIITEVRQLALNARYW